MQAIAWLALLLLATSAQSFAATKKEILEINTPAIVYLEVTDNETSQVVNSGTGFVVSHHGYVVTVAHLKASPNQTMWSTVGARFGTRFPLVLREVDEINDVALWQFPQSQTCKHTVTLTKKNAEVQESVLALGFPAHLGLTSASSSIINLQSERGFHKVDGFLEGGFSGGPVFNEDGRVMGLVQGGTLPGTENNDIVPISLAINLISKRNALAGIESEIPFPEACYSTCRHNTHGVEKWQSIQPWKDNTSWLDGGSNPEAECRKIAAGIQAQTQGSVAEVTSTREEHQRDPFFHDTYKYFCEGVVKSNPIFNKKRSEACGLWK